MPIIHLTRTDNMKSNARIIGIILIALFVNSCANMTATKYLRQCHAKIQTQEGKYCLSSFDELKTNLTGGRPLFYVGTDSIYDYFVFYDDRTTKLSVGFNVPKGQFNIENPIAFEKANYHLKEHPIYLSQLFK